MHSMDTKSYITAHTNERVRQLCELAGTKPTNFSLVARGHGKFSLELSIKLEAASRVLAEFPDDILTIDEMHQMSDRVRESVEEMRQKLIEDVEAA